MENNNKTRYLIVGKTRSGTTLTHIAIMGHPNATGFTGEVKVQPLFFDGITTFSFGYASEEEKQKGYSALFDAISLIGSDSNTMVHGCKTAFNSPHKARQLVSTLQKHFPDLKIIIVIRNDLVANYGSAISGAKSGVMHSWNKGFTNRKVGNIHINKWLFTSYVLQSLQFYDELRKLKNTHDVFELIYEDVLSDAQDTYDKLFHFLGLPQLDVTWMTSKKVLPNPQEYIKNYAQMAKLMRQLEDQHKNNSVPTRLVYTGNLVSKLYSFFKLR